MIAILLSLAALFTSASAQVCKVEKEKWDDRYKIDTNDVNPDWQGLGFTEIADNFYMIPQSDMLWSDFPDKCDALCASIPICKGWKIHQKFESYGNFHCCHLVSDCEIGTTNSYSDDWTRSCCGPTPTVSPTDAPTMLGATPTPIPDPTMVPTGQPTALPTAQPTEQPTAGPTRQPSAQPTMEPTSHPTALPTAQPTEQPTAEPTRQPSAQPTTQPTPQPTPEPTRQPTQEPAEMPTDYPTHLPTVDPTPTPTRLPTPDPSAQPTLQPSPEPTRPPRTPEPSFPWPTRSPTLAPTVVGETMRPTSGPTIAPTPSPFADTLIAPTPEDDASPFFTKPEFWLPLLVLLLALLAWIWWKFCRAKKPERMSQQPLNLGFKSDFNTFDGEDPKLTIGQHGFTPIEPLPAPPVVVEPGFMSDDETMGTRQVSMPQLPPAKPERDPTLRWRVKM